MFRQTNIVWIVFITGLSTLDIIKESNALHKEIIDQDFRFMNVSHVLHWATQLSCILLNSIPEILIELWSFVLCIESFIIFLVWNKGIVLGT